MPEAKINGHDLYYERVGEGPAIAFIHGGYGGAASSVLPREEAWVSAFSDAYTVITYDRRSAGRSAYPDSEYTMEDLASDLRELLRHLAIERAFIVGSSAGGPVALTYALTYPETIAGLVLPNTSSRLWQHEARVGVVETVKRRARTLSEQGPQATFDLIEQEQAGDNPLQLAPQGSGPRPPGRLQEIALRNRQVQELVAALDRADLVRYTIGELRNQAAFADSDLRSRLNEIAISTLVLHGDGDTQVPYALGVELSQGIAGAEFVTVPGAGHGVMQWDVAVQAIRAFCDRTVAAAGGRS